MNDFDRCARTYPLLSSDSHIFEPPELWTTHCPDESSDRVPQLRNLYGQDVWMLGDKPLMNTAAAQNVGKRLEDDFTKLDSGGLFDDVPRGAYDPDARIVEQDKDGVGAEVLYSTVGMMLYCQVRDVELLTVLAAGYNDWLAGFCAAHPARLKGMAMLNTDDVPGAVRELRRAREAGLTGAMIPVYPQWDRTYGHEDYEPLWTAAADLGMPLALHVATNRPGPIPTWSFEFPENLTETFLTNLDTWIRLSLTEIILSGVFERHPTLMIGSVEHELAWIPYFLYQLDYTYDQRLRRKSWWPKFTSDLKPSDYFRRNIFTSFQEDPGGISDRHTIGLDNLMWGSDYPHPESTYPKSEEITTRLLADVPDTEREKILAGNAARIFGMSYRGGA